MRRIAVLVVAWVLFLFVAVSAQGGPFTAQIEQFWNLISNGGRTFQSLSAVNATITGTCTGCGGVTPTPTFNSITMNVASANAAFQYGPGQITTATPARTNVANTIRLASGATNQNLAISGNETADPTTSYYMVLTPPNVETSYGAFGVRRGDVLGVVNLAIYSDEAGVITLGNEDTPTFALAAQTNAYNSRGSNMRSDACYGMSNIVSGPALDAVTVCLQWDAVGSAKMTSTSAGGIGSLKTGIFSSTASEVIASNTTIAPTHSVFHVSGTNAIATITVPAQCTATCLLTIIPDGAFTTTLAGNIGVALTAVPNEALLLVYDGTKFWPGHGY